MRIDTYLWLTLAAFIVIASVCLAYSGGAVDGPAWTSAYLPF